MPAAFHGLTYDDTYLAHREEVARLENEPVTANPFHSLEYVRDIENAKPRRDPRSNHDKRSGVTIRQWWRRWRSGAYNRSAVVRRALADYCEVNARYELISEHRRAWASDVWRCAATGLRDGNRIQSGVWVKDAAALICCDLGIWLDDVRDDIFAPSSTSSASPPPRASPREHRQNPCQPASSRLCAADGR